MKARLTSFVLVLSMLIAIGAMPSKADAQVVVKALLNPATRQLARSPLK